MLNTSQTNVLFDVYKYYRTITKNKICYKMTWADIVRATAQYVIMGLFDDSFQQINNPRLGI